MTTTYVNWGTSRVKLTWKKSMLLPQYNLITSVHGFCFQEDKLLLIDLKNRGWDFPGGHIEPDEKPVECFKREALEEGYIEGECKLLGYIIVDHSENPMWTESSPYQHLVNLHGNLKGNRYRLLMVRYQMWLLWILIRQDK